MITFTDSVDCSSLFPSKKVGPYSKFYSWMPGGCLSAVSHFLKIFIGKLPQVIKLYRPQTAGVWFFFF